MNKLFSTNLTDSASATKFFSIMDKSLINTITSGFNFEFELISNFARKPSGGDRDQIRSVAAGEGDLALVNSYYFLKMKSKDNEKKLSHVIEYFPKDNFMKTHINISGAGIIKNSKNKENAVKFLEFLVSDEAQKIYAEVNFEYPIRKNIELNKLMKKYNYFIKED